MIPRGPNFYIVIVVLFSALLFVAINYSTSPQLKDGWRTGWLLARVPHDVNGLVLGLYAKQKKDERLMFADVQLVKLRDAPDGAKELLQTPKTKK